MHIRTKFLTNQPQKTHKRIIECFKQGKDPQGYPINGWKMYLDTLDFDYADCYEKSYGSLLVYEVNGEEKKTCLILHAVSKDIEEKQKNDDDKKTENNPFEKERYISATTHFWTPYEKQHPSNEEKEVLLKRFDDLMETQFATLFYDIRKIEE